MTDMTNQQIAKKLRDTVKAAFRQPNGWRAMNMTADALRSLIDQLDPPKAEFEVGDWVQFQCSSRPPWVFQVQEVDDDGNPRPDPHNSYGKTYCTRVDIDVRQLVQDKLDGKLISTESFELPAIGDDEEFAWKTSVDTLCAVARLGGPIITDEKLPTDRLVASLIVRRKEATNAKD